MSFVLSISSILSLISFFTTVLALVRVGSAAFSSNQAAQAQIQLKLGLAKSAEAHEMTLTALRIAGKQENRTGLEQYVSEHDLVRMSTASWQSVRKPGLLFRPPSPFPSQHKPLSMAKLIMTRHNLRRPGRMSIPRRPPGLPLTPSSHSRLIEEVA